MKEVEYDRYGRMKCNPIFHPNSGKPWTAEDENYLIGWFDKIGTDEMSLALGRTTTSIMQRVTELRKQGIMSPGIHRNFRHVSSRRL